MSDDCCIICCCCCTLFSLCGSSTNQPSCWSCSCWRKIRRSRFDDDAFIDEVLRETEHHRVVAESQNYDPEGHDKTRHYPRQPEPVAQMNVHYPPMRTSDRQQQPLDQREHTTYPPQPRHHRGNSDVPEDGGGSQWEDRRQSRS